MGESLHHHYCFLSVQILEYLPMMDIPVIINNKHIITQVCSYIQNYLLDFD